MLNNKNKTESWQLHFQDTNMQKLAGNNNPINNTHLIIFTKQILGKQAKDLKSTFCNISL